MPQKRSRLTVEAAAEQLRNISLTANDGDLLGSETEIVARLGVSLGTVRQVARILEREGLLHVRRGINGGYYCTRPSLLTIEANVAGYLDMLSVDFRDIARVASVLWIETIREAASLGTPLAREVAEQLHARVDKLSPDISIEKVMVVEEETRAAIFKLIDGRYIELIFHINVVFARRRFPRIADEAPDHLRAFVQKWKAAKLMELVAIADGDPELGMLAARYTRGLWERRSEGDQEDSVIMPAKLRGRSTRSPSVKTRRAHKDGRGA